MKKLLLSAVIGFFLTGCSVHKEYAATGGSKADGTIELSYEIGALDTAILDEKQGYELAKQRCERWGYKDAEKFGGHKKVCNLMGGLGGCNQFLVTVQYQCIN